MIRVFVTIGVLLGVGMSGIAAQNLPPDAIEPTRWPRSTAIYSTPEPLSLMWYDAQHAAALVRRAGLLVHRGDAGRETRVVRTVEIVEVEPMEEMPPAHRRRWDLVLNGEPLDWAHTYVEWGGRLVNLQLLFTYRNQRPVPAAPFILE